VVATFDGVGPIEPGLDATAEAELLDAWAAAGS